MSLQYAVLGLLQYKEMTGYDLKKLFDKSIKNIWAASLSQIYRELGALESRGSLTSEVLQQCDRPDKKIYKITNSGKVEFKEWITNFPKKLSKEKRDEFSLRVFFGSNLKKEDLIKQFQRFLAEKNDNIEELKSIEMLTGKYVNEMKLINSEDLYWKLILKRAYMNLETSIVWANECIKELEQEEVIK